MIVFLKDKNEPKGIKLLYLLSKTLSSCHNKNSKKYPKKSFSKKNK